MCGEAVVKGKGTRLTDALELLSARLDKRSGGGYLQALVADAWKRTAGPSVVAHTTGAHLRQGELLVNVDSPVWATELSALSEHYRQALNEELGEEAVKSVRFTVSRKVQLAVERQQEEEAAEREEAEDKVASAPLTDQEKAQVYSSASVISDPELREAAIRATIADLEWKKGLKEAKRREAPRQGP